MNGERTWKLRSEEDEQLYPVLRSAPRIRHRRRGGHEIRVVDTWFSGAKLYIDGDCRDTNTEMLATKGDRPLLSATFEEAGEKRRVEVFVKAVFTTKIKICIDGKQVAGEAF